MTAKHTFLQIENLVYSRNIQWVKHSLKKNVPVSFFFKAFKLQEVNTVKSNCTEKESKCDKYYNVINEIY